MSARTVWMAVALTLMAVAVPPRVTAQSHDLVHIIEVVKPSVVCVGTFNPTRSPASVCKGTGFAVGDGLSIITNQHVVAELLDSEKLESFTVMLARDQATEYRKATLVSFDKEHDLAHLRIEGARLPALELGDSDKVVEGQFLGLTGFPIGAVLGIHPVTHRAMVSAITPVVMPAWTSKKLDVNVLVQLQRDPYNVIQLDGTALPGNSGSPLYDLESGQVVGVINKVFVQGLKEAAITAPSGISYAIPVKFVKRLLERKS